MSPKHLATWLERMRAHGALMGTIGDARYALKSLVKTPIVPITVIGTIGLGLGLLTAVFTFFNAAFLRPDAVVRPDELYAIDRPLRPNSTTWIPFQRSDYESLRRENDVLADTAGVVRGVMIRMDGRPMNCVLVSGSFFQMLGVPAALGRTLTPADDEPQAPRRAIVLSHVGFSRLSSNASIVGGNIAVNGVPYEIVGVMPDTFRGLEVIAPSCWAPLALANTLLGRASATEDTRLDAVIGRLKPGISAAAAVARLSAWSRERDSVNSGPPQLVRLTPSQGTVSPDVVKGFLTFVPLFFAFALVLLIGCANVANFLLARIVLRQREIGTRFALGASRTRLFRELLTENLILASASAVLAHGISRLVLRTGVHVAVSVLPPEISQHLTRDVASADWRVFLFLAVAAALSTIVFGVGPALRATRLPVIKAMRGDFAGAKPGGIRTVLVGLEVGASALLLICSAVFLRAAISAADVDPGVRTEDTMVVPIRHEEARAAMIRRVAEHQLVIGVAASSSDLAAPLPVVNAQAIGEDDVRSEAPATAMLDGLGAPVEYQLVSPEYFEVLGISMMSGRSFSLTDGTPAQKLIVVSADTARKLWPSGNAVGQRVRLDAYQAPRGPSRSIPDPIAGTYTVIGVAANVGTGSRLFRLQGAGVYVPVSREHPGTSLMLRVHGDSWRAREQLLDALTPIDPGMADIKTMRTTTGLATYLLRASFWVTALIASLALTLTVTGLFGVLSYLVEQRRKEIGIRMALGASKRDVVSLVLTQSSRPVLFGLLGGGAIAGAVAAVLRSTSAAAEVSAVIDIADPWAYIVSTGVVLVASGLAASVPTLRAVRVIPSALLKND